MNRQTPVLIQEAPRQEPEGFYDWTFPGAPVEVRIALSLVDRLSREIAAGAGAHPREVGGLLFGCAAGPRKIEITDFQPLVCEEGPGTAYVLCPRHRRLLNDLLASNASGETGTRVVGYYRTHLSDPIQLREEDLALAGACFAAPDNVVLVIQPAAERTPSAGLFFWDNGTMHADFCFMEFPFDAAELAASATPRTAEPRAQAASPVADWLRGLRPRLIPALAVAAVVLLIAAGALWLRPFGARRVPARSPAPDLALHIETRDAQLVVRWNRAVMAAMRAGLLSVTDGASVQNIPLTPAQLRAGSVGYAPRSNAIRVQLEAYGPGTQLHGIARITLERPLEPVRRAAAPKPVPPPVPPRQNAPAASSRAVLWNVSTTDVVIVSLLALLLLGWGFSHRRSWAGLAVLLLGDGCLMAAVYLASAAAQRQVLAQRKPDLSGNLLEGWAAGDQRGTDFAILAQIVNAGSPTVITGWKLELVSPDGRTRLAEPVCPSGDAIRVHGWHGGFTEIPAQNLLCRRLAQQLLPYGEQFTGWLIFRMPRMKWTHPADASMLVRLRCSDAKGKEYAFEKALGALPAP